MFPLYNLRVSDGWLSFRQLLVFWWKLRVSSGWLELCAAKCNSNTDFVGCCDNHGSSGNLLDIILRGAESHFDRLLKPSRNTSYTFSA